jgi:hypothetical protein
LAERHIARARFVLLVSLCCGLHHRIIMGTNGVPAACRLAKLASGW